MTATGKSTFVDAVGIHIEVPFLAKLKVALAAKHDDSKTASDTIRVASFGQLPAALNLPLINRVHHGTITCRN